MKKNPSIFTHAVITAIACGLPYANAAVISSITTDNIDSENGGSGTGTATTATNLTSLTAGGVTYASSQFASTTTINISGTSGSFTGSGDYATQSKNLADTLTDLDLSTGKANNLSAVNFIFSSSIFGLNPSAADFAIFELGDTSQTDSWTIQAIVGGSATTPTLGGTALTFIQNTRFGDTGHNVTFSRDGSEALNQNLMGLALSYADLGLTTGQEVIGLQITSAAGDPSLVIGLVPEPSSAMLCLLGFSVILRRRR